MSTTDRIEKRVTLRAPVSRVWRAIADAKEFGQWFGFTFNVGGAPPTPPTAPSSLDGDFEVGKAMRGTLRGQLDEAAIMARMEPERHFAFRWIPYGIDADADPSGEPTTLVEFRLEPTADGTLLTIVESGFDRVPAHRRARAFLMNEGGWSAQAVHLAEYVHGA